jgi:hypothetical protein
MLSREPISGKGATRLLAREATRIGTCGRSREWTRIVAAFAARRPEI